MITPTASTMTAAASATHSRVTRPSLSCRKTRARPSNVLIFIDPSPSCRRRQKNQPAGQERPVRQTPAWNCRRTCHCSNRLRVGIDRADNLGTDGARRRVQVRLNNDDNADRKNDNCRGQSHPFQRHETFLVTQEARETGSYAFEIQIIHFLTPYPKISLTERKTAYAALT